MDKKFTVCPGVEGFSLYKDFKDKNRLVFIVDNDSIEEIIGDLSFFFSDHLILALPGWDINFYDRISPSVNIQQQRIKTIFRLVKETHQKIILVTSLEGLMLKTIGYKEILKHKLEINLNQKYNFSELQKCLISMGYTRSANVCDYNEFAVRGSIIDIYDNEKNLGIRLDFFGDVIDSIKFFDPSTQKTFTNIDYIELFQASEVILSTETKENFLQNYKKLNPKFYDCPFYQAIQENSYFSGQENFLPLFYPELFSIFDYLEEFEMVISENYNLKLNNLYHNLKSAYLARIDQQEKFKENYYPVQAESMWLSEAQIFKALQKKCYFYKSLESDLCRQIPVDVNLSGEQLLERILAKKGSKKILFFIQNEAIQEKVKKYNPIKINSINEVTKGDYFLINNSLSHSFENEEFFCISEDIFLRKKQKSYKKTVDLEKIWDETAQLNDGDYIIHKLHGVGIFHGIYTLKIRENNFDCVKLSFADNDILYLPIIDLDLIKKYKSDDGAIVKLDKLGNSSWQLRKAKIKNRIKEIALELLKIAAIRRTKEGRVFEADSTVYEKFAAEFPYIETVDQQEAINAVLEDLASGKPMDRLICGDVGFGKTEVAIRAAFVVTNSHDKAQVAIIAPTTLLARQHYQTLQKRFAGYNIKIAQISRFVKPGEVTKIKNDLENGDIDIVVGTHSLLASSIKFFDLGLVIVDEEHHFGVKQKEKLKQLKENCHVLTLSATPIPRTLQMSIVGIKELSLIATPPIDRIATKTMVIQEDYHIIIEAINKELQRGGSVFFVSPRIAYLHQIKEKLDKYKPGNKSRIAHGQMKPQEIEDLMIDFFNRKFDIFLSTSIIESGIDLPFVNTIIIHRSDMFGLAALYQLRGRVGRSKSKSYAYLLLPKGKINKTSFQRLEVMQSLDNLGAGFSIASSDMDIRGFGNLLGEEQSGHIKEVGVELYQDMLIEAINELENKKVEQEDFQPNINLGFSVFIPDSYIGDAVTKLSIYKKAGKIKEINELFELESEFIDRFGKMPEEVQNFLTILTFKIKCKKLLIDKIDVSEKAILIGFKDNNFKEPEKLFEYIKQNPGQIKIRNDQKLVLTREFKKSSDQITYLDGFLEKLLEMIY